MLSFVQLMITYSYEAWWVNKSLGSELLRGYILGRTDVNMVTKYLPGA